MRNFPIHRMALFDYVANQRMKNEAMFNRGMDASGNGGKTAHITKKRNSGLFFNQTTKRGRTVHHPVCKPLAAKHHSSSLLWRGFRSCYLMYQRGRADRRRPKVKSSFPFRDSQGVMFRTERRKPAVRRFYGIETGSLEIIPQAD